MNSTEIENGNIAITNKHGGRGKLMMSGRVTSMIGEGNEQKNVAPGEPRGKILRDHVADIKKKKRRKS